MGTTLSRHFWMDPLSSYFTMPDWSEQYAGISLSNGRAVSWYLAFRRLASHPAISKAQLRFGNAFGVPSTIALRLVIDGEAYGLVRP